MRDLASRIRSRFHALEWSDRAALALVTFLALLAAFWCLSSLWLPFGWDHGVFGAVSDVIRRGGLPYRDVWEIKGPLALYVYALAQGVGHPQMWGVRCVDLVFLVAGARAGFQLVKPLAGIPAAVFGVTTTVLGFAGFGNWYTAQPDGWAAELLIVLVALLVSPEPRRVWLAGALLGALCLLKPTYVVFGALCLPPLLDASDSNRRLLRFDVWGPAIACTIAPIAAMLAYLAAHGALGAFVDQHLRFNQERIASDPSLQMSLPRIALLATAVVTNTPELALALPFASLGIALTWHRRRTGLLLALWLVCALFTIAVQRKFLAHNYSWHPVYPPILLGAAIGLGCIWTEASSRPAFKALALCYAFVVSYHLVKGPAAQTAAWARWLPSKRTLEDYRATFEGPLPWLSNRTPSEAFGFSVNRDVRFAEFVRRETPQGSPVYVWCDPLVNYLADRPSPSPITAPEAFTLWGSEPRRARYRREFAGAIRAQRAELVAVPTFALEQDGDPEFNLHTGFPELARALDEAYVRTGTVENLVLFRPRRAAPATVQRGSGG